MLFARCSVQFPALSGPNAVAAILVAFARCSCVALSAQLYFQNPHSL